MKTLQLFITGKLGWTLTLFLAISTLSYGQKPDRKETISYINQKLAPLCRIEVKGGTIIATYNDKSGTKIREDKVAAFDLDTVAHYDLTEKILSVNCLKDRPDAVTRTLYVQKIKRQYSRITFVIEDEATVESITKALLHLIKIDSQFSYSDEISFE